LAGDILDCAVIGGGAAGLTAATYLGRFRRSVAVFDDGRSRLLDIPRSRNVPGFPEGVAGPELHARMLRQASQYGLVHVSERVITIERTRDLFKLRTASRSWDARAVVVSTGIAVTHPEVPDLPNAVARGLVRYCPICDGLECAGKRVGVLASKPASLEEAVFLRTYVDDVTLLPCGACELLRQHLERAAAFGITVATQPVALLDAAGDVMEVVFRDGARAAFDVIYPCLGSKPRSDLAVALGADVTPTGGLLVDSRQQTSIPMLYAAGDVVEGLDQIASGCGQAAIAATAIHNQLRDR
jgi:thioredoxin reductase (NADPH)